MNGGLPGSRASDNISIYLPDRRSIYGFADIMVEFNDAKYNISHYMFIRDY